MEKENAIIEFWNTFLKETNRDANLKYYDCFYFGHTEELANELLKLVLKGNKKATSSSRYAFEIEKQSLPRVGDFNIVTDWDGLPYCVIETTNVIVLPFKEMTYDICKREGEDDNLESWQKGHIKFFTEDGKETGYTFTEDMPIVFEDFEVVYALEY